MSPLVLGSARGTGPEPTPGAAPRDAAGAGVLELCDELCDVVGLAPNAVWRLRLDNTSITRLELPGGRLLALNDIRHLPSDDLDSGGGEAGAVGPRPEASESAYRLGQAIGRPGFAGSAAGGGHGPPPKAAP